MEGSPLLVSHGLAALSWFPFSECIWPFSGHGKPIEGAPFYLPFAGSPGLQGPAGTPGAPGISLPSVIAGQPGDPGRSGLDGERGKNKEPQKPN